MSAGAETVPIDAALVRGLVREQFPGWAGLAVRPVQPAGNDHLMFRLGDDLCVRVPRSPDAVLQLEKEQAWIPRLAGRVPLPIPTIRGAGRPSPPLTRRWSVCDWIPGEPATSGRIDDPVRFAGDLAAFLVALRSAPGAGAPGSGRHNAFRGAPLQERDAEMRDLLHRVSGRERDVAAGIWSDALASAYTGPPVWFHGDVSANNLIVRDGALTGVIDFGCAGAGDPACDTGIVWTFLHGAARATFQREIALDAATWARGRGLALWKGLIMITNKPPGQAELARHVLDELFAGV